MSKFDPSHPVPCVYLKHGRYWLVKRNKWTDIGTTLEGALLEYSRRLQAGSDGGMSKLIDDAMPSVLRGKAKATVQQYEAAAKMLKRKLTQFAPERVTTKTVFGIQASLAEHPNMANRAITVLRLIFTYAVKHHPAVTSNPCTGVKRLEEAKRGRLLTPEEWSAIHMAAGPRLRVIMELQYLTGQRINDVLKIKRSQLTDEGIAFVQQKTSTKLLVRWSPALRATVDAAKALSADNPAVTLLRGRYGSAPDYRSVLLQWNEACAAAGVEDARFNDGRAMAATNINRQGGDAQALLGHASATMTKRYLRGRETPEVDGPTY